MFQTNNQSFICHFAFFLALVILVGGILGRLGYFNLMNVNAVLLEITDQCVPSVQNAMGIVRLENRLIILLQPGKVLDFDEQQTLAKIV